MIKVPYEAKVALAYHQINHDDKQGKYQPNFEWDYMTYTIQGLLLTNLPRNSVNKTLTDIGSGQGKWPALLSPYFDQVVSIEPDESSFEKQKSLNEILKLENIDLYNDGMPECLEKINSQAVLLSSSLHLTEDWKYCFQKLLNDPILQWIAIFDGPDLDTFDPSLFSNKHGSLSKRRPITIGDEWYMHDQAEEQGWFARLFNIDTDEQMAKTETANRWLLLLER